MFVIYNIVLRTLNRIQHLSSLATHLTSLWANAMPPKLDFSALVSRAMASDPFPGAEGQAPAEAAPSDALALEKARSEAAKEAGSERIKL